MSESLLPILRDPAVLERTSATTRRVLQQRVEPIDAAQRFLPDELYALLEQITSTVLPQGSIGTEVDIAGAIDRRLSQNKNAGWRFADLPEDGEAYVRGLTAFSTMLQQTPMKMFDRMPQPAREGYLRCVANGDVDGPAQFPLSKWLGMVRTDVVRTWLAHPAAMQKIEYYGFADGETGRTNGATATEGWSGLTPNKTLPFEKGISLSAEEREA